ncbi:MAG TPA: guanylate kinase [Longimicrobiales bacterium]|nr:guanylate kinase [Longimicrobiales bacterium]
MIGSRGFALVIAAPSGSGKTTLARALVEKHEHMEFSVSATTRPKRAYEEGSKDYHFVDDAGFDDMVESGEMLEWATVHNRKYGTPRREVEARLKDGRVVVLDIDVQGAKQVRASMPEAVLVFVLPPSAEELRNRLTIRASEGPEERRIRLQTARQELKAAGEFDYIVVNDDFDRAMATMEAIILAEQCRITHVTQVEKDVQALDAELARLLERNS